MRWSHGELKRDSRPPRPGVPLSCPSGAIGRTFITRIRMLDILHMGSMVEKYSEVYITDKSIMFEDILQSVESGFGIFP